MSGPGDRPRSGRGSRRSASPPRRSRSSAARRSPARSPRGRCRRSNLVVGRRALRPAHVPRLNHHHARHLLEEVLDPQKHPPAKYPTSVGPVGPVGPVGAPPSTRGAAFFWVGSAFPPQAAATTGAGGFFESWCSSSSWAPEKRPAPPARLHRRRRRAPSPPSSPRPSPPSSPGLRHLLRPGLRHLLRPGPRHLRRPPQLLAAETAAGARSVAAICAATRFGATARKLSSIHARSISIGASSWGPNFAVTQPPLPSP